MPIGCFWKYARGIWLNDYVCVIENNAKGYVQGFKSNGYFVYLTDGLGNYVLNNGKNYIKRKQCRLIMHNGTWQKAEQKLSLYEFK